MTDQLYVPTDEGGAQWLDTSRVQWPLPAGDATAGEQIDGELVLYTAAGLLGRLDERIYRAESLAEGSQTGEGDVRVGAARLVAPTGWDGFKAAGFALDCAEHVAAAAGDAALSDGTTLAEVLTRAREWLTEASESESGFGERLRQLAICRRLRRTGKDLGDLAFSKVAGDIAADLEVFDDPEWTAIASARDAVLAAVEAVQHAVMPWLTDLESRRYEQYVREGTVRETGSRTRAHLAWVPYWTAADDAAERARQAAADGGGAAGAETELAWQAELLAAALS